MSLKITIARIAACLCLGSLALGASARPARAAGPKRLGVLTFRGPGEAATRRAVMKAGQTNRYQVIGGHQINRTAGKLGVKLDSSDGFKAVSKELNISAFVSGEVTSKKATLTVRSGADGSVSAEAGWSGPNPRGLAAAVARNFWKRLGGAIERGRPPAGSKQSAVAEEESIAPAADEAEPGNQAQERSSDEGSAPSTGDRGKSDRPSGDDHDQPGSETTVSRKAELDERPGGAGPTALDVAVGPRILTRSLSYNQDIYGRNSRYSLPGAPALALQAELYPAALKMGGQLANLGLTADLEYLIPVVTTAAPTGNGSYGTDSLAWAVGAKFRLPFGLFVAAGYGDQSYSLKPKNGATGIDVPKVDYRYVRGGAGIRYQLAGGVALMGEVAYLQCLSLGQIGQDPFYKNAKGAAFEAGVGVGYRFKPRFEVRAGAELLRFGLDFRQKASDFPATVNTDGTTKIAGGAIDQYLSGWIAIAWLMGGS